MRWWDILLAVVLMELWGFHAAIIKIGTNQAPVIGLLAIRFILTGLIFLPFMKLDKRHLRPLIWTGFIMYVLAYGSMYLALSYVDATTYTILSQATVPLAVVVGYFLYKEQIGWKLVAGIVIALAGIVLMFGEPRIANNTAGMVLILLNVLFWTASNILMKNLKDVCLSSFIAITALVALPFIALWSVLFERDQWHMFASANWWELSAVLFYQVVFMSLCMMTWQRLLARNDYSKLNPMTLLIPLFGVLGGIVLLDEILTLPMIQGAVVIMIGVAAITFQRAKKADIDVH